MKNKLERRFPAYEGAEPYLYLCFSAADEKRVRPLMERLYARGCRVWYLTGRPESREERQHCEDRRKAAALTVFYLTAAARDDTDVKSAVLSCQDRGTPILCVDGDDDVGALGIGLSEKLRHIRAADYRSAARLEEALVRCEGFSQELIGEDRVEPPSPLRKLALALALISLLTLSALFLGNRFLGWFAPPIEESDTVMIEDETLRASVRAAVGGGAITPDELERVTALRLREIPADGSELALLPALERLEIPQSQAADALWLLDEGYTLVLYGGDGA